jgi:pentatricopeptide repeat protein
VASIAAGNYLINLLEAEEHSRILPALKELKQSGVDEPSRIVFDQIATFYSADKSFMQALKKLSFKNFDQFQSIVDQWRNRPFERTNILVSLSVPLSEEFFLKLVTSFCERKEFQEALRAIFMCQDSGIDPIWNMFEEVIVGLCAQEKIYYAGQVLRYAEKIGLVTKRKKFPVINSSGEKRMVDLSENSISEELTRMLTNDIDSNVKGDKNVTNSLQESTSLQQLEEVIEKIKGSGNVVPIQLQRKLAIKFLNNGDVERARLVASQMEYFGNKLVVLEMYNSIIKKLFEKDDLEGAKLILKDMLAFRIKPNEQTFHILVKEFATRGMYSELVESVWKMYDINLEPSSETWNFVARKFILNQPSLEDTIRAVDVVINILPARSSLPPRLGTALSREMANLKKWDFAVTVIERLKQLELQLPLEIDSIFIQALSYEGRVDEAIELLKSRLEKGETPTHWAVFAVVEGLVKQERGVQAMELLEKVPSYSTDTCGCLIDSLCKQDDIANAAVMLQSLLKNDRAKPNPQCLFPFGDYFTRHGEISKAQGFLNEMQAKFPKHELTQKLSSMIEEAEKTPVHKASECTSNA